MGTFLLIGILLFIIASFVFFVFNKVKEKKYEENLAEDILKTKKIYKGRIARYINTKAGNTIIRYFISGKTNTINDFIPSDEIFVKNCLILFDEHQKKISIIKNISEHGTIKSLHFSDIISLQPVEISKTKKITRGGISPISVGGYRWASVSTKRVKEVERVYIELKYKAYGNEQTYDIPVFVGLTYKDRDKYSAIVEKVNFIINKFHNIVSVPQK